MKRLDKIERIERDPRDVTTLSFSFKAPERAGRVIFELEDGRVEVPGRHAARARGAVAGARRARRARRRQRLRQDDADRDARRQAPARRRQAAQGPQRAGRLPVAARRAARARAARVLDAAQRATRLTPNKARALLGQFLFSGEDAQKPVAGLSGGERQRLSLAILVHSGANVLILDEPTNHLDVESREALEEALEGFAGSVLLVSHDRALLDAVGSRTVAVEDGTLHSYDGGWADYLRMREERRALAAAALAAGAAADKAARRRRRARWREGRRRDGRRRRRQAGSLEERDSRGAAARARDRGGRSGAAGARAGAGGPGGVGGTGARGGLDRAPHRGQARGRGAVRPLRARRRVTRSSPLRHSGDTSVRARGRTVAP